MGSPKPRTRHGEDIVCTLWKYRELYARADLRPALNVIDLIGEKEKELMTIGDSRLALTIAKDDGTRQFKRGMRFLIDDPDSAEILAYEITKSNRMFNLYNGVGVYRFILREVTLTSDDNLELQVADYYGKGFKEPQIVDPEVIQTEGKWL